ncbi:MAG TPA: hypothetical protein VLI90_18890 [Tepidisphaeraceae bacterium]|nr:hypothetical protein [Tepidisphaeraceae bacterium]
MFGWLTQHLLKRATNRSANLIFDKVSVHLTADGFELQEAERMLAQVKWLDIVEARAFKRDLLTTDRICVLCRIGTRAPNDFGVEVHEEMPGFID